MPIFIEGLNLLVGQLKKLDSSLRELRRDADIEVHERVDLRAWTAIGVGGVASLVVRCHSEKAVQEALDLTACHGLQWVTLGGGSRLVPPDEGIRVPVLSLSGGLGRWELELDGMVSGSGANLAQVCRAGIRSGLGGLESLGPGDHSVGGLIRASAAGVVDLNGLIDWIDLRRPGAEPERWRSSNNEIAPSLERLYRRVITSVRFKLSPIGVAEVRSPVAVPTKRRIRGSSAPVFIDPPDTAAADLLAETGCSVLAVGGVRIGGGGSNELIAGRSATAAHVLELCRRARDRVLSATGIELACALTFVDEDGREIVP